MTKGRDNAAERLGDVLALIRSRRHNGMLSIEHFEGGRFEEGEIYFVHGKPVYAHLGDLPSQEALATLLNWRQVYFLFVRDAPMPSPQQDMHVTTDSTSSRSTGPIQSFQSTDDFRPVPGTYERSGPSTGPLQNVPVEQLIPRKLVTEQNVLALPLTRPQRSLYMLVDGHRTIADLSRFTHKSVQEVAQQLKGLREYGLIIV